MSLYSYKDNVQDTSNSEEDGFPPMASVFRANDNTVTANETILNPNQPVSRRRVWMLRMVFVVGLLLLAVIGGAVYLGMEKKSSPKYVGPLLSTDELDQYLQQLVGTEELQRADSYTSQAYRWMLQNPFPTQEYRMRVEDRVLQRYALACLYYATYQVNNDYLRYHRGMIDAAQSDLPTWINNRGWLVFANECDWYGVTCNQFGYVTSLDLGSNQLTGELPSQLQYLSPGLELLNIEFSSSYNTNPNFIGQLVNLKYLYMRNTLQESDGIPLTFAALTQLEEFDCSYSLFHGPLREDIFQGMTQLRYLEISGNKINGPLPQSLIQLPHLKYLYADHVGLTGDWTFLQDMDALIETWLDRNPSMTGALPPVLGEQIESLSLTRNNITSSIPSEWGSFTQLKHLWLYDNLLTGSIPDTFRQLSSLETFEVEVNSLTGSIEHMCSALKLSQIQTDCELGCSCCECCGAACTDAIQVGV